mmetsp:Transcript_3874/g.10909  ORF Transcript_3874/g.10909 Transcript_3874/m.10909 type:complete len:347 (-) Transcript_3874:139-1179(-)
MVMVSSAGSLHSWSLRSKPSADFDRKAKGRQLRTVAVAPPGMTPGGASSWCSSHKPLCKRRLPPRIMISERLPTSLTPVKHSRTSLISSTAWHSAPASTPAPPQSEMVFRCTQGAPPIITRPSSPRPENSLSSTRPFAFTSTTPHRAMEKRFLTIWGALPVACMHVPQRPAAARVQPTSAGSPPARPSKFISTAAAPWPSTVSSRTSRCRLRTIAVDAPTPSKRSTGTAFARSDVSHRPSPSSSTGRCSTSVAGRSCTPALMSTRCSGSSTGTESSALCRSGKSSEGVTMVWSAAECESEGEPQSGTQPRSSGCVQPASTRRNSAKTRAAPGSGDSSSTARPARST